LVASYGVAGNMAIGALAAAPCAVKAARNGRFDRIYSRLSFG
jgi:hypothetical protein